jgi:ribosomal protein S2
MVGQGRHIRAADLAEREDVLTEAANYLAAANRSLDRLMPASTRRTLQSSVDVAARRVEAARNVVTLRKRNRDA